MKRSLLNFAALALVAASGVACVPPLAPARHASALAPSGLSDVAAAAAPEDGSVTADAEPIVESFAVRGSSLERVRASVEVSAPVDRVRAVVFDYARYPEFMPRYEKAAVLRVAEGGGRTVRMELGGIVHLWMRVEISPPRIHGETEAYEGRLVDGNIKAFVPRWELTSLSDGRTRITLESFLDPDLFLVPSSMINAGARDALREAVVALKARIEGR